jgi:hypothetical protein
MTITHERPASLILRAESLMRQRAEAASPGRRLEMCMGSEGCQVINDGKLRDRKHVAQCGRKEWNADHADAVHIASWGPIPVLAVADWLRAVAVDAAAAVLRGDGWTLSYCDEPGGVEAAMKIASAYLSGTGTVR